MGQIKIDKMLFFAVLQTLNCDDQMEIYKFLKKTLFQQQIDNTLKSLKTDELSMEDITAAVEEVRQERYATGKQIAA